MSNILPTGRCKDHDFAKPCPFGCHGPYATSGPAPMETSPKDKVGATKLSILSVVPASSIIYEAQAMHYGAFNAPRKDGGFGYGPFNWRTSKIIASRYIDPILRHALRWWDREDLAPDSRIHHLAHLKATCGVVIDAIESGTFEDDRPPAGSAGKLLDAWLPWKNP